MWKNSFIQEATIFHFICKNSLETIELSFVEIIKSSKNVHLFYGRRVGGLATALHLLYDSLRSRQEKECIPHPAVYFSYFSFDCPNVSDYLLLRNSAV